MKIKNWTLWLATAGLVSISPALVAQTTNAAPPATNTPPPIIPLQTALSATTISGYVDTSAVWNPGTGNANPAPYAFNAGKQDGFNVNALDVKIARAEDAGSWGAGYVLELSYGPDATAIDGGAAPIRQAYVDLNMPVGNGIDWQIGRWDNLLGYESSDSYKNPNYTRSYGYSFEPTEHTGLLATYKFCDAVTLAVGGADTVTTLGLNSRSDPGGSQIESKKALVSLLTLTAPDSWGGFKGSAFYAGFDYGQGATTHDKKELYVGTTINTPVKDLTFGASWDAIFHNDVGTTTPVLDGETPPNPVSPAETVAGAAVDESYFQAFAGYASYKLTDKLTLNLRGEYADGEGLGALANVDNGTAGNTLNKVFAATGTLQYDLWANVIARLEFRWDHAAGGNAGNSGDAFGGIGSLGSVAPDKKNEVMVGANVIYKF